MLARAGFKLDGPSRYWQRTAAAAEPVGADAGPGTNGEALAGCRGEGPALPGPGIDCACPGPVTVRARSMMICRDRFTFLYALYDRGEYIHSPCWLR